MTKSRTAMGADLQRGKTDVASRQSIRSPPSFWIADHGLRAFNRKSKIQNCLLVLAAEPKFKLLAHNTFEDDSSRANASIGAVNGELLLRTDQALYCIANRP